MSVILTVIAALIESPTEFFYLESLSKGKTSARLFAEAGGLLAKSISTYVLLRYDYGLTAYALSSLIYSLCLNLIYLVTLPSALKFDSSATA